MSENKCYCFPEPEKICTEYRKISEDPYIAEKTCDTIKTWLGGKNLKSFSIVSVYAVTEYQKYVCTKSSKSICAASIISEDIHSKQIDTAIRKLAKPCPCENN